MRARAARHLKQLQRRFKVLEPLQLVRLKKRDYPVRLIVPFTVWIEVMGELVSEQTWSNFKDEAKRFAPNDKAYHRALFGVWYDMRDLESVRRIGYPPIKSYI